LDGACVYTQDCIATCYVVLRVYADSGLIFIGMCPAIALLHAQELLELSLSAPGRVPLPRAPPHSLLLFDNQFSPFPAGWGLETPLVSRFTGDRLQLRDGGQQMRQEFRQKVRAGPHSARQWGVK
jgi:hypothetical protein